jgi:hypothetical protein
MQLLVIRRRLRLQPFDRVGDALSRRAAGHVAVFHELVSAGGRLEHGVVAVALHHQQGGTQISASATLIMLLLPSARQTLAGVVSGRRTLQKAYEDAISSLASRILIQPLRLSEPNPGQCMLGHEPDVRPIGIRQGMDQHVATVFALERRDVLLGKLAGFNNRQGDRELSDRGVIGRSPFSRSPFSRSTIFGAPISMITIWPRGLR